MKVWKAFAAAYPNEDVDTVKRKYHVIASPNMKLGDYVTPLISPSLQWVTFLSLSNITCVRISLRKSPNLDQISSLETCLGRV